MDDPRVAWLRELAQAIPELPHESEPRPYWSQRHELQGPPAPPTLSTVVRRVRREIEDMRAADWFAETLGYACVDGNGDVETDDADQLNRRIGKPHLADLAEDEWTEDDLCDYLEVFHDLAARPTRGWVHSYGGCGFHPSRFSRPSGQRIYRWRINKVLQASTVDLRLADEGEDVGRIRRVLPDELDPLASAMAGEKFDTEPEIPHAIALYRRHNASREDRRMAVVGLARVLEARRSLLRAELLRRDEGALFEIANRFDLRHRLADQMAEYGDEYLDWIFHWYLATIALVDRIAARSGQ